MASLLTLPAVRAKCLRLCVVCVHLELFLELAYDFYVKYYKMPRGCLLWCDVLDLTLS